VGARTFYCNDARMSPLQVINAGLALTIEVCMLWAYGAWGFRVGESALLHWSMMLVAVAVGIALWAIWAAPKSAIRLRAPGLYVFKACMFATAGVALVAIARPVAAIVFLIGSSVHLALAARGY
jgi:hypothetical protein